MKALKPFISVAAASILAVIVVGFNAAPAKANFSDGVGPWADSVYSFLPGLKKDQSTVAPENSDPWQALGVAEGSDPAAIVLQTSGVSLGFRGQVTLKFENTILNQSGYDLQIYHINHNLPLIFNRRKLRERVKVQVSANCWKWYTVGFLNGDGKVDLGPIRYAKCVQLTDMTNGFYFPLDADGYDVDGVMAIHTTADQPWLGQTYDLRWWQIDDNKNNDLWLAHNIMRSEKYSFCTSLWKQGVTFHNNWEMNSLDQGIPFQQTYYSTVGRSVDDGLTMSQINDRLLSLDCGRYTNRDAAMREFVKTLTRINKGQYLWSSASTSGQ